MFLCARELCKILRDAGNADAELIGAGASQKEKTWTEDLEGEGGRSRRYLYCYVYVPALYMHPCEEETRFLVGLQKSLPCVLRAYALAGVRRRANA